MESISKTISDIPGIVGLSAKHLESGKQIHHNADQVFFTASTLKVPILFELYRQVDNGLIDISSRISIEDKHRSPGSGVLKELVESIQPTIHDLALLMIIISDNSATDILFHLLNPVNINRTMTDLGLYKTRIPMSCKDLLYSMYGVDTHNVFEGIKLVGDRLAQAKIIPDSAGMSETDSDVSSPNDMTKLLEIIYKGEKLSEESSASVIDILERQQFNTIIPYLLPAGTRTAHKTGGVTGVRCDVGIVFGATGPYTIALMAKDLPGGYNVDSLLARVSEAVYKDFNNPT